MDTSCLPPCSRSHGKRHQKNASTTSHHECTAAPMVPTSIRSLSSPSAYENNLETETCSSQPHIRYAYTHRGNGMSSEGRVNTHFIASTKRRLTLWHGTLYNSYTILPRNGALHEIRAKVKRLRSRETCFIHTHVFRNSPRPPLSRRFRSRTVRLLHCSFSGSSDREIEYLHWTLPSTSAIPALETIFH